MLNFLAKAAVVAVKAQATRAVDDAVKSGYNSAKKKLAQKKAGKRKYQSKTNKASNTRNTSKPSKPRNAPKKQRKN